MGQYAGGADVGGPEFALVAESRVCVGRPDRSCRPVGCISPDLLERHCARHRHPRGAAHLAQCARFRLRTVFRAGRNAGADSRVERPRAESPTISPVSALEIDGERVPLFAVFAHQIKRSGAARSDAGGRRGSLSSAGCGTPGEQRGYTEPVAVFPASPAFFNFVSNPDGRNPVVALHGGGPALVGPPGAVAGAVLTPAAPGEIVTLFGTGFGPTEPAWRPVGFPESKPLSPAKFRSISAAWSRR